MLFTVAAVGGNKEEVLMILGFLTLLHTRRIARAALPHTSRNAWRRVLGSCDLLLLSGKHICPSLRRGACDSASRTTFQLTGQTDNRKLSTCCADSLLVPLSL